MGRIVAFRPEPSTVETAWAAYDAAQLEVVRLYQDQDSTPTQRRAALLEALRLHDNFARLSRRAAAV
ncbi:MAG: hypothetical protein QOH47_2395 [Sphingomonadales bacterium]|jgi:hypothetical protein|nr:hypothetical protein [Sphingomonadales bacterium]